MLFDLAEASGLSLEDERLLRKVARCRTSALGGALESCAEGCGFAQVVFRSCGDRHCPGCGGLKGARWLEQQVAASLPVRSFHCVVTLRPELRRLARENPRALYGLQHRAAHAALQATAREVLGEAVELGVTSVLHTWNRWGAYHPHVHLIASAGGLSADGARWVEAPEGVCLLPAVRIAEHYRVAWVAGLERLVRRGLLRLGGAPIPPEELARLTAAIRRRRKRIEVYAKRGLDGPQETFRYLARYVTRLGINNARLVAYERQSSVVTLETKKGEPFRLQAKTLLRRFLLHRLPKGMHRVRHAGLYAPRSRARRERARALLLGLGATAELPSPLPAPTRLGSDGRPRRESVLELYRRLLDVDLTRCPVCGGGLTRLEFDPWQTPDPLLAHLDHTQAVAARARSQPP